MKVQFKQWSCVIRVDYYNNNRKAIELIDIVDGETVAFATTNVSDQTLTDENHVFIKNYSENESMTDSLIKANVIYPNSISVLRLEFVNIYEYKLTPEAIKLWD